MGNDYILFSSGILFLLYFKFFIEYKRSSVTSEVIIGFLCDLNYLSPVTFFLVNFGPSEIYQFSDYFNSLSTGVMYILATLICLPYVFLN